MTPEEWLALTSEQRNHFRKKWGQGEIRDADEHMRYSLIESVSELFSFEYGNHPLINSVSSGGDRLVVTTALYPGELIEELPTQYYRFPVEQDPINGIRDHYLKCWHLLFRNLLGWPDKEIEIWASQWDDGLNGRDNPWFYHESEYAYALREVVRSSGVMLKAPDHKVINAIQTAIERDASSPIWLSPVDWDAVRSRVNDILAPLGGRLPK